MNDWRPFNSEEFNEDLVDGVPDYLHESLVQWIDEAESLLVSIYPDNPNSLISRHSQMDPRDALILEFDRKSRFRSGLAHFNTSYFFSKPDNIASLGLKYIDFLIMQFGQSLQENNLSYSYRENIITELLENLDQILDQGGSKWRVGIRGNYKGLESCVDPTMKAMADDAINSNNNYSHLLGEAWHLTFGRNPNYSEAYSLAIKAVESIMLPLVSPKDTKGTLSKAACVMRDQNWTFELTPGMEIKGGIGQVLADALIKSHPDRHGTNQLAEVTEDRAKAAVFTAVYLIQCFKNDLIKRNEE